MDWRKRRTDSHLEGTGRILDFGSVSDLATTRPEPSSRGDRDLRCWVSPENIAIMEMISRAIDKLPMQKVETE